MNIICTETPDDKEVFDKYYNDAISSAQEKYGTDADWESWFGENVKTKEEVDKWLEIQKACDDATEAKKKYLETPISKNDTSLDLTSQLTESDDKGTSKATLADLRSEADLLKTVQKKCPKQGKSAYLQCKVLSSNIQKQKKLCLNMWLVLLMSKNCLHN